MGNAVQNKNQQLRVTIQQLDYFWASFWSKLTDIITLHDVSKFIQIKKSLKLYKM